MLGGRLTGDRERFDLWVTRGPVIGRVQAGDVAKRGNERTLADGFKRMEGLCELRAIEPIDESVEEPTRV